ncbi:MAG: hypothetical protein FJ125_12380, partial [Deltaproteobacteria bacterium]|nr:hypothetical protein [Deltaproteobacteria bacterium]
ALEEQTPYRWRVAAVDKAGIERLSGVVYHLQIDELDLLRTGGLLATYYDGVSFNTQMLWRLEPTIDQPDNSDDNPFGDFDTAIGPDTFSVIWDGWVLADFAEVYTFYGTSDDGQRLFVRDRKVIDDWQVRDAGAREALGSIALTPGWNYLRYEFFENMGGAVAKLEYSSARTPRQVIPADHLAVIRDDLDDVPPVLADVRVEGITPDAAVVMFTADEEVDARVEFGGDAAYGREAVRESTTAVRLTGLQPGMLYHYRLTLTDRFGNEAAPTEDLLFCTPRYVPGAADDQVVEGKLRARYFRGKELAPEKLALVRAENGVDQPAGSDNQPLGDFGSGAGPDGFSGRWQGMLRVDQAGERAWRLSADDGQRLFVDAERLVNDWKAHQPPLSVVQVAGQLDASWHDLRYEMYDDVGQAFARVELQEPGMAAPALLPVARLGYVTDDFYKPTICAELAGGQCLGAAPIVVASDEVDPQLGCGVLAKDVLLEPVAYDCQDPHPVLSNNLVDDSFLPLGESTVTWTATNRYGLQSFWNEKIVVQDLVPPTVIAPAALTMEAVSSSGTDVVPLPAPLLLDDICDDQPQHGHFVCQTELGAPCLPCWSAADQAQNQAHVAGQRDPACICEKAPAKFPLVRVAGQAAVGTTRVVVLGEDASQNCASAAFDVTIKDETRPDIDPGHPFIVECRREGEQLATFAIPVAAVWDNASPASWFAGPPQL